MKVMCADPGDQGHWEASRFRIYIILWLKSKITEAIDIHAVYDAVTVRTKLLVPTSASDHTVSSTMEVSREAEQMAFSRRKRFRPVTLMSL